MTLVGVFGERVSRCTLRIWLKSIGRYNTAHFLIIILFIADVQMAWSHLHLAEKRFQYSHHASPCLSVDIKQLDPRMRIPNICVLLFEGLLIMTDRFNVDGFLVHVIAKIPSLRNDRGFDHVISSL